MKCIEFSRLDYFQVMNMSAFEMLYITSYALDVQSEQQKQIDKINGKTRFV